MSKPIAEIKDRIREALDLRQITQQELANKTGIPKSSISQYLTGYSKPRADRVYLMAVALSVNEAWLLGFDVIMQRTENSTSASSFDPSSVSNLHTPGAYKVPILGEICAGDGVLTEECFKGWFFLDGTIKCDYVLDVKGDSMEDAGIFDGDKVMILVSHDYAGRICAVVIRDTNEAVLKRVDPVDGKIILSSYNKKYAPMTFDEQDVFIVGECIGVYHAWE